LKAIVSKPSSVFTRKGECFDIDRYKNNMYILTSIYRKDVIHNLNQQTLDWYIKRGTFIIYDTTDTILIDF